MFIARRILWLPRPGDANDPLTGICFSLHICKPTPHSRGKPRPQRIGSFFIHSTPETYCQGFLIRPQNRFCQDLPVCGAGIQVGSQLRGSSPALLLLMVNLWRIEPWVSAPGSSLAWDYPGSICRPIWGIFAAWLAQGLKRQHKTGHVATLPMGRGWRGSRMKYCDRTLQAPANHSCWGLKSAIHPLVSGSAFLATLLIQRSPFNLKQRLRLSPVGLTAAVKATGRAIVRPLGKNNRTLKGGCGWIGERGLACARGRLASLRERQMERGRVAGQSRAWQLAAAPPHCSAAPPRPKLGHATTGACTLTPAPANPKI